MTEEEFAAGLDRWGGDLGLWPAPEQGAARAVIAASPAAWRALQAMLAVEAGLSPTALRSPVGVDALPAQVSARPQRRLPGLRLPGLRLPMTGRRVGWAAVAGVLLAGFVHGALAPQPGAPPVEEWFTAALSTAPDGFDAE